MKSGRSGKVAAEGGAEALIEQLLKLVQVQSRALDALSAALGVLSQVSQGEEEEEEGEDEGERSEGEGREQS